MSKNQKDPDDNKKELETLPEKVFVARNSLLTDLFENKHIQTIYHVFGAIMVGLFFNTIFYDYLKHQRLHFGSRLIIKGFGNFHWALLIWIFLVLVVCSTYLCFCIWAKIRTILPLKSNLIKIWDTTWVAILVVYYLYSYYLVLLLPEKYNLAPCSACCVITEYTRMLMKVHSFVRTNAPKVLNKNHTVPTFAQFIYFFFAPTFLYRDEYPRTKQIRWKFVFLNFAEVVMAVFFLSFITERNLVPVYEDFCLKKYLWIDIVLTLFANAVAGMLFMLTVFYCVLHSWQNAFAEMLTFADRLFYTDWWTSTTLPRYFRTWNILVYDWLYTYIYKDFYEIVVPKNRSVAKLMVFFVSALFHEIMLTAILRVFMPMMFLQFMLGSYILYFIRGIKNMASNIIIWYCIALGAGTQISFYCIEYYARYNYVIENKTVWDFFKLRSLLCGCIE